MKKIIFLIVSVMISISLVSCGKEEGLKEFSYNDENIEIDDTLDMVDNEIAHVVLLYGQSNAVGVSGNQYLKYKDLDKYNEYNNGYDNVFINYYNDYGLGFLGYGFEKCCLGCGYSMAYFGPEMGIAERMHEKYPDEKVFIIKRAWCGTALKTQWLDGNGNRGDIYNSAMDFTLKCLNYLKSKGYNLSIEGICWMQGENDTLVCDKEQYLECTTKFVELLRFDLKPYQKSIKFIDALIGYHWDNSTPINDAKKEFMKRSSLNYLIDTTMLTTNQEPEDSPDLPHYDALSMVCLGNNFGNLLILK